MKAITIRDVDGQLAHALEQAKRKRGTSLNRTVLDLLRQALGLEEASSGNGLRKLAGAWSEEDLERFEKATAPFEQVDEELWA